MLVPLDFNGLNFVFFIGGPITEDPNRTKYTNQRLSLKSLIVCFAKEKK
jgi:hypothetical protein